MAFCQHRMHWLCCKTKRSQWPAYGARALCSVFSLRGLEQIVDRDRSSGHAVRFASSNLKQLTCIQAFYLVSILTQSTCKKIGYLIYIYMSDMLPDMFIDAEMERVREEKRKEEKRREEERRSKKRKSQKKEGPGPGARKGRKVAKRCVFPMICGSRGSKSRLAKAAGAGPCGQMRDEKLHAVVAQNTFPIQNVQCTSASELF